MSLVDTLLKLISIESETGKEEKILDFINQFLIENNFKGEILRSSGGIVAVTKESNLLNLSVLNYPKFGNQQMNLLEGIKQHLVSIDLSYSLVNDSIFYRLAQFPNLVQIKLNHTQITGEGISQLNTLKYLKKLYLVETALEGTSLPLLLNLPAIEQVFVYQSKRNLIEEIELTPELESIIVIGAYTLPRLASDAIVYWFRFFELPLTNGLLLYEVANNK